MSARTAKDEPDDTEARRAVMDAPPTARILVEAGPGTGKTEIAARRLATLLQSGIRPAQILVLSFSRSAVKTLTSRLSKLDNASDLVLEELRHLSIRTFDSWAFRQLRLLGHAPGDLLRQSHDSNIEMLTGHIAGKRREDVRSGIGSRRHLIVDEFQDLPGVRGDLVLGLLDLLCSADSNDCGFTILGDPAQAIYGFAARQDEKKSFPSPAEYWRRVLDYYGDGVSTFHLSRNYRSTPAISELALLLRGVLLSDRPESEKLELMKKTFAELPVNDTELGPEWLEEKFTGTHAILTRTNGEALRVLQQLVGKDVDGPSTTVRLKAGGFATLPPAWIGALLRKVQDQVLSRSRFGAIHDHLCRQWNAEQQARLGLPAKDVAWGRLLKASGSSERETSFELAALRERMAWPDAFPDDQLVSEEGVFITTVHQSKGMEFEAVTVLDMANIEDGDSGEETLERASVGYVALTRAEKTVRKIDAADLYAPLGKMEFSAGRVRHRYWRNGWMNLEMGLEGDVDPFGFVDPALLGGAEGVEDLQSFLLDKAADLAGRKVILKMNYDNITRNVSWRIHLQEGTETGRLVGRTADQLSQDIYSTTKKMGYKFPYYVYNLRVGSVGSITSTAEFPLQAPESRSRLWLGVSLFGTGDFKTKKGT